MSLSLPEVNADPTVQQNFRRIAQKFPLSNITTFKTVKDYGAKGNGTTDDTAAIQAGINAVSTTTGGVLLFPTGDYKITSGLTRTGDGLRLMGAGPRQSVIVPTMSTGYALDLTSSHNQLYGIGFDGTNCTGDARAWRLAKATSRNVMQNVEVSGYNADNVFACRMEGSLDNTFINCDWQDNKAHLQVGESSDHAFPSNENTFIGCKFQTVRWASGSAVAIGDSEGNRFRDCLFQSNEGLYTFVIENTATGGEPDCRLNQITGCWFEQNGNNQANSHHIHVAGYVSTSPVIGTVVRDNMLLAAGANWPHVAIYRLNSHAMLIDGNYDNFPGAPTNTGVFVESGADVTATSWGHNIFVGDLIGSDARTTVASAATITLPSEQDFLVVTGATTITSITASWRNRIVELRFDTVGTQVTKGSNLKMPSNFVATTSEAQLVLACNGVNWIEMSRSLNS